MSKFHLLSKQWLLCSSIVLTYPSLGWADASIQSTNIFEDDISSSIPTNPQNISALNLLQSLKNSPQSHIFTAPNIQEFYTQQNVRTLFAESKHLPIVDLQLTFNAGSARDESIEKGLFGLAHLTAQLLNQGTDQQTTAEIAANFAKVGAQYSAQAHRDMFIIKLRVRSEEKYLTPALDQLIKILTAANFPQASLDRLFNNVSIGQKQVQENPSRALNVRFYRTVYDKHPYAEPPTGTIGSLKQIKPQHLQAFRDKYLVNHNLNLAITGNIPKNQANDIANLITQHLPMGTVASALDFAKAQDQQKIIALPFDSTQAHIMIGQIGITRNDPDRIAMEVGNEILGGSGFTSLLMQELREKRGFTYSASSQLSSLQSNGIFAINYATRQDQLLASIEVAHQTLLNFVHQPLDAALVETTKISMLRNFPQYFSNNANLNAQLGMIGFYQLPTQYLTDYPKYIQKITAQDIQQAWQKHLQADRLLTVIAGKNVPIEQIRTIYAKNLNRETFKSNTATSTNAIQ